MSDEHAQHHVNYFVIFLILCGFTALSVACDIVDIKSKALLIGAVLGVATAKALFVMMYFMHLKFEGNWKFLLLGPTIILGCSLPLALFPDIGAHYYTVAVPQVQENTHTAEDPGADNGTTNEHH